MPTAGPAPSPQPACRTARRESGSNNPARHTTFVLLVLFVTVVLKTVTWLQNRLGLGLGPDRAEYWHNIGAAPAQGR
jgi:hypothetical protein